MSRLQTLRMIACMLLMGVVAIAAYLFYQHSLYFCLFFSLMIMAGIIIYEGGNLAASKIRNLECPSYEICLIDYGCGKFNRKIHIMEQYP